MPLNSPIFAYVWYDPQGIITQQAPVAEDDPLGSLTIRSSGKVTLNGKAVLEVSAVLCS